MNDAEAGTEQAKPVAWAESYPETGNPHDDVLFEGSDGTIHVHFKKENAGEFPVPLYTHPPAEVAREALETCFQAISKHRAEWDDIDADYNDLSVAVADFLASQAPAQELKR